MFCGMDETAILLGQKVIPICKAEIYHTSHPFFHCQSLEALAEYILSEVYD